MSEQTVQLYRQPAPWYVYIIQSLSGRLYTGITTNVMDRWQAHRDQRGGAKFFRGDKPQQLLWVEPATDRSHASKREYAVKQLSRRDKIQLIRCQGPIALLPAERA